MSGTEGTPVPPTSHLVPDVSVKITWFIPKVLDSEAGRIVSARFAMRVPSSLIRSRRSPPDVTRWISDSVAKSSKSCWPLPGRSMRPRGHAVLAYHLTNEVGPPKLAIDDFIDLALAFAPDCRLVKADRAFCETSRATTFEDRLLWVADPL